MSTLALILFLSAPPLPGKRALVEKRFDPIVRAIAEPTILIHKLGAGTKKGAMPWTHEKLVGSIEIEIAPITKRGAL